MLNFWKRPISTKAPEKFTLSNKPRNGSISVAKNFEPWLVGPLSGFDSTGIDTTATDKSRLQLTIQDCLNDKTALAHFTQYLDLRGMVKTLQLYFDVDLICSRNILQNEVAQAENYQSGNSSFDSRIKKEIEVISAAKVLGSSAGLNAHDTAEPLKCDLKDCDSYSTDSSSVFSSPKKVVNSLMPEQSNKLTLGMSSCDSFNSIPNHCDNLENCRRIPSTSSISLGDNDTSKVYPSKIRQQTDEPITRLKDINSYYAKFETIMSQGEVTEQTSMELSQLKSVLSQSLQEYWLEFATSELYYKFQVEVLTNGSVDLGDILNHETALSYFMEFLEGEGCQSIVEFWLAASHFQRFLRECGSEYDAEQAQADAVVIYDKYLSLQATSPLGFSSDVRCAVELAICRENELPLPNCFDAALHVALAYLKKHCLPVFFSSQHYVRFLSDMIKCSSYKTNSPASSVSEFSTDSKQSINSKNDPDFIWRKRQQCGLSLGHIDQLGRFETTIEPEPDRKSESKLSRVVKKLVNKGEDKVQEEMAWRVAEMIIKDVTNVTMGGLAEDDDFS